MNKSVHRASQTGLVIEQVTRFSVHLGRGGAGARPRRRRCNRPRAPPLTELAMPTTRFEDFVKNGSAR